MRSRNGRIRECLLAGPSTSVELSTTLGLTRREVCVGLLVLQRLNHVRSKPGIRIRMESGGPPLKLYELTKAGSAKARQS